MLAAPIALALAAAGPAAGAPPLAPASEAAILAGGQTCLAALRARDNDTPLAGWTPHPGALARTDGDSYAHDGVLLTVSHHGSGACWVQARNDGSVHMPALADALASALNARQSAALGHILLHLPGGGLGVLDGAQKRGHSYIFLKIVFAKGT